MTQDNIYELCKEHMHAYVLLEMKDGSQLDGIITGLDDDHVYLAVPMSDGTPYNSQESSRQFGYGPYGYGYGSGFGYGYPRPRFRRVILPLTFLAALSLLPWY